MSRHGAVALATRDYGGDGPDLLFLHGAGQTLVDCDLLAPWLTTHHRVVAMDLRGHGLSGDGPFSWTAALDDIDAVTADLGLRRPAVVGHSLGGLIAAMHGARHPDTPGVVNLDGHGPLSPDRYVGTPAHVVTERLAELRAFHDLQVAAARLAPPVLPEAALLAAMAAYQTRFGLDESFVRQALTRSHIRTDQGFTTRPCLDLTLDIVERVNGLDNRELYLACKAPMLVVNAISPEPAQPAAPAWMDEHLAAYRRGLSLELRAISDEHPSVTVVELDATHALLYEQPELVGAQITTFLGAPALRR